MGRISTRLPADRRVWCECPLRLMYRHEGLIPPRRLPRDGKSRRAVTDAMRDADSQQVGRAGKLETQAQPGVDMTVRGSDEGGPADLHKRRRDKAALILESRVWQHAPQ